jgi:hypothetical protein
MWWILWTLAILLTSMLIFAVVFVVSKSSFILSLFPFHLPHPLIPLSFQVVSFVDLENDDIPPREMTQKSNQFVLPEYIGQGLLTLIFLLTGNYLEFFINLPLLIFHARRYYLGTHFFDPTRVFDVKETEKRIGLVKLGFYMITFCFYIYRLIYSIVVAMKPASRFSKNSWL